VELVETHLLRCRRHGAQWGDDPNRRSVPARTRPLRVSNLQTGLFSGEVGSSVGTHRHRPDGLVVRTETPELNLWAPTNGRLEVELPVDPERRHRWEVEWCDAGVLIGCEGTVVFTSAQVLDYPMFLMLDLFETSERSVPQEYPKRRQYIRSAVGASVAPATRDARS